MRVQDFENTEPRLVLEDYFVGNTKGWGMVFDRFGNLRRQFTVDMNGTWDGETLVLEEDFVFDDGEKQRRTWMVMKKGSNEYVGTAGDVVGKARGLAYGNALAWNYRMNLKIGESYRGVDFDDWMFLQPGGVLLNKAKMSRFGVRLGQLFVAFSK